MDSCPIELQVFKVWLKPTKHVFPNYSSMDLPTLLPSSRRLLALPHRRSTPRRPWFDSLNIQTFVLQKQSIVFLDLYSPPCWSNCWLLLSICSLAFHFQHLFTRPGVLRQRLMLIFFKSRVRVRVKSKFNLYRSLKVIKLLCLSLNCKLILTSELTVCCWFCLTAVLHPPHPDRRRHYWHGWHKGGHCPGLPPSHVHHHRRCRERWLQWHADAGRRRRDPVFSQRRTCSPRHCPICSLPELQTCKFIDWDKE